MTKAKTLALAALLALCMFVPQVAAAQGQPPPLPPNAPRGAYYCRKYPNDPVCRRRG
jgi:hypothetical protein